MELPKCFWKQCERKRINIKHRKTYLLAKSKFISTEKTKSKASIDSDISHEKFKRVINGKKSYLKLKENTGIKNRELGHIEKNRLIEYDKRIGTN